MAISESARQGIDAIRSKIFMARKEAEQKLERQVDVFRNHPPAETPSDTRESINRILASLRKSAEGALPVLPDPEDALVARRLAARIRAEQDA